MGDFEEVVLLTVAILHQDAYGVAIKKEIEERLERKVSIGALRTALNRLEKKGFLASEFGEATQVRGGKRKRYYKATQHGIREAEAKMAARQKLWSAIPPIVLDFSM